MLRPLTLTSFLFMACGGSMAKPQSDGSYSIDCESQKVCLDRAEKQCGAAGYKILDGQHSQKLAGVPGNQKVVNIDTLHVRCKSDLPKPGAAAAASNSSAVPVANGAGSAAPTQAPAAVCRPGETQKCVGPGACTGGQACNGDGTGFGVCDCGNASPLPAQQ